MVSPVPKPCICFGCALLFLCSLVFCKLVLKCFQFHLCFSALCWVMCNDPSLFCWNMFVSLYLWLGSHQDRDSRILYGSLDYMPVSSMEISLYLDSADDFLFPVQRMTIRLSSGISSRCLVPLRTRSWPIQPRARSTTYSGHPPSQTG